MGRKLSEREKATRAAARSLAKQKAELGPLFEAQAVPADERELMLVRRMGWARLVEHHEAHLGDAVRALDRMTAAGLRAELVGLLPPDEMEAIDARVRACPPDPVYALDIYKRVLRDRFGRSYTLNDTWRRCPVCKMWHAPGQLECYRDVVQAQPEVSL